MRRLGNRMVCCIIGVSCIAMCGTRGRAQQPATSTAVTAPTTAPATSPTSRSSAEIADDAKPLLAKVSAAYKNIGPTQFEGDIVGDFDVAGRAKKNVMHVVGRTDGTGLYRHDAQGVGLLVNDGKTAFLYDALRGAFAVLPATTGRIPAADMDDSICNVLLDENPALLLSITDDATALLAHLATSIKLTQSKLVLETPAKKSITLSIDSETGFLVGSTIDYSALFAERGATGVKASSATLTYVPTKPLGDDRKIFTWQPPADATQFEIGGELLKESNPSTRPTTAP